MGRIYYFVILQLLVFNFVLLLRFLTSCHDDHVLLCRFMFCYVGLCFVMSVYVMLCYVNMLCYVMSCYVMLSHGILC